MPITTTITVYSGVLQSQVSSVSATFDLNVFWGVRSISVKAQLNTVLANSSRGFAYLKLKIPLVS